MLGQCILNLTKGKRKSSFNSVSASIAFRYVKQLVDDRTDPDDADRCNFGDGDGCRFVKKDGGLGRQERN